jgi:hypothetical protein
MLDDATNPGEAMDARLAAVDAWQRASACGQPILAEDQASFVPMLIAETLRRAEARDEALDVVEAALVAGTGETVPLEYIADLAVRCDYRLRRFDQVAPVQRLPSTRRVAPQVTDELESAAAIVEVALSAGRLVLRRGAEWSGWTLRPHMEPGVSERQLSVTEAVVLVAELDAADPFMELRVLEQTGTELDHLRLEGRAETPGVAALARELVIAEARYRGVDQDHIALPLAALGRYLLGCAVVGDTHADVTIVTGDGSPAAFADAIHVIVTAWPCAAIAMFEAQPEGYVQLVNRPARSTVYLEALDPAAQGYEPLAAATRREIETLGWVDPKQALVPYPNAEYGEYWGGGNFVRELPRESTAAIARLILETLNAFSETGVVQFDISVFPTIQDPNPNDDESDGESAE